MSAEETTVMQHFLHQQHPLELVHLGGDDGPAVPGRKRACAGCDDKLSGPVYACDRCRFYLHKSCANLPQQMKHSLHPCPLFLQLVPKSEGAGVAGGEHQESSMLSYRCKACNFEMDAASGQFQSVGSKEEGALHFSHEHPLQLIYVDADAEHPCNRCKKLTLGKSYACHSCRYYLHETCATLPHKIRHFFHPCTLSLEIDVRTRHCDACSQYFSNVLFYHCEKCDFDLHVECTKFQPVRSEEEGILHFSHHHPLRLSYLNANTGHHCNGCKQPILEKTYACQSCEFYLDEHCAKLQHEIQHFFHPCILLLKLIGEITCDACTKQCSNMFVYHCEECSFNMDVECAMFQVNNSKDGKNIIQCWSHIHPLQIFEAREKDFGRNLDCVICGRGISSQTNYAACEFCSFYTHKSCMDLPQEIQHRCHPCPLSLTGPRRFCCNTCLTERSRPGSYSCKKCEFNMDIECALFSKEIAECDQAENILHFSHHHPLQLFKDPKRENRDIFLQKQLACLVCRSRASGLTYGCKHCDIYLHKTCLDILPQTISMGDGFSVLIRPPKKKSCNKCGSSGFHFREVPYNPRTSPSLCILCALQKALSICVSPTTATIQLHFHPCSLTLKLFSTFTCNACFTHCHSHAYHCDQCDFYVGIKCAQISMKSSNGEEHMQHFCHWHSLQEAQDAVSTSPCNICGSFCSEPFYFCKKCNFHIHKSCLSILPQKIDKHYFNCTLVLLTTSSYRCISCQKENNSGLTFCSIEKGFKLCMKCVLWPKNKLNEDDTFTSIHHWHRLMLLDKLEKDVSCLLCRGKSSTLTYYCRKCNDYFHRTCAELPSEMLHPLHQGVPLTLISSLLLPESRRSCSVCLGDLLIIDDHHSGVYHCQECNFQVDKKCATLIPSIYYQGHFHLLTIVENMHGQEVCQVCSTRCTRNTVLNSQKKKSNYAFRCAECNYNLHLSCGPLPCKIKHSCHVHPLILEDFFVEENYTDEFACHICENRRDPKLPVYRCIEGCPMICEITCVISEVMPILLGARGDVELRTTFPDVASKVITRTDMKDVSRTRCARHRDAGSLDIRDTRTPQIIFFGTRNGVITQFVQGWEQEMLLRHRTALEREDDEKSAFTFSKEAFGDFSGKLGYTYITFREIGGIPEFILQHDGRMGSKERYYLPQSLIPIYQDFFDKYNILDTTAEDPESGLFKPFFVFIVCAVLHDMRTTKLVDLTNVRVRQWLTLLKLVEQSGFDIGFIFDKIKLVWQTHFLIEAKALVDDTSRELQEEVERLSRLEEELVMKLEATRKKIRDIKKQQEVHREYENAGMRSLRKEYKDALLIKWKPASSVVI